MNSDFFLLFDIWIYSANGNQQIVDWSIIFTTVHLTTSQLNKTCQHNSTLNDIGTKQNAFLFNIYFINQSKTRDICLQKKKKNSTRQLITRNNEKNLKKHYEYKEIQFYILKQSIGLFFIKNSLLNLHNNIPIISISFQFHVYILNEHTNSFTFLSLL